MTETQIKPTVQEKKNDRSMNHHQKRPFNHKNQQTHQKKEVKPPLRQPFGLINYPEELPISAKRDEIKKAIQDNQVIILCGETGSGKTTQIPKMCLELGRGLNQLIGCTQPRRIATRSVCKRLNQELNQEVAGYKIRFQDTVERKSHYFKLMTDGVLLAETQTDKLLRQYDTIIIDEAHERSLNIDFLLGYLHKLLPKRPDLKVIITSATIDSEKFAKHFHNAPVIEVSGRTYPVDVKYRPLEALLNKEQLEERENDQENNKNNDEFDEDLMLLGIGKCIDEISMSGIQGDILIFLPGEREIRHVSEFLRKHTSSSRCDILPLFSRLSIADQERIFKSSGHRKIILSTNIAETSLTVPNIRYVIDSGLARLSRYSPRSQVQKLQIEKISKASANQRSGRCGRVMNGICYRLYSEEDFASRNDFTDPEILRTSLASVILQMESLRLGDIEKFPFIDKPLPKLIRNGYLLLQELGAISRQGEITPLGKQLVKLPVDPKIGRMLLAGQQYNCLHEMLIISSALSVQDPRERPFEYQQQADQAHQEFVDKDSDFMSFLKLWAFYDDALKHKKSNKKLYEILHKKFLSFLRMREWRDVHGQLHNLMTEMGFRMNQVEASYTEIHQALMTGLLGTLGYRSETSTHYIGAKGIKFLIFPGSALRKSKAQWIMASEIVETKQVYGRCVARIEPQWVEYIGRHLCKSSYSDPHWEKKLAQVSAFERVTLYGLPIIQQRKVHYGPIDPKESRDIFIRQGLVEQEVFTKLPFYQHNQNMIKYVEKLENKTRRRDILIDDELLFDFYDKRIPQDIYNLVLLDKWLKSEKETNPKALYLKEENLIKSDANLETQYLFPDHLMIRNHKLKLDYQFDPGEYVDGVSVFIPLKLLNQFENSDFDYLVLGLLKDKITQMIKSLPTRLRRELMPILQYSHLIYNHIVEQQHHLKLEKNLLDVVKDFIFRTKGIEIFADDFDLDRIEQHLLMRYIIVNDERRVIQTGRDLEEIKHELNITTKRYIESKTQNFERYNITHWDSTVGDLSTEVKVNQLVAYPAFCINIDNPQQVDLKLFESLDVAQQTHRDALIVLFKLNYRENIKFIAKSIHKEINTIEFGLVINYSEIESCLIHLSIGELLFKHQKNIYKISDYQKACEQARTHLYELVSQLIQVLKTILSDYKIVKQKLGQLKQVAIKEDIESQINALFQPDFVIKTPLNCLKQYPRYLKSILARLEKVQFGGVSRDLQQLAIIKPYLNKLKDINDSRYAEYRWALEELRIGLFTQEIKTLYSISTKRIDKIYDSIK